MFRLIGPGRVVNMETGEVYVETSNKDWMAVRDAWSDGQVERAARLTPVLERANRRRTWRLYQVAARASYKRYPPAPMPVGHAMFRKAR